MTRTSTNTVRSCDGSSCARRPMDERGTSGTGGTRPSAFSKRVPSPSIFAGFVLGWTLLVGSFAFANPNLNLASLRSHPRLLASAEQLAFMTRHAKEDPLYARLVARVVKEAEEMLEAEPLQRRLVGIRLLDQSRLAVRRVLTCAMAFHLTNEKRFAARARADMLRVAEFQDWNPAHFLDVAEMSMAVALGYDLLHAQLSAAERAAIRGALIEKAIRPGLECYAGNGSPKPELNFVRKVSNWNQVCNGGLVAAALAVADEAPELTQRVLGEALKSIPHGMSVYAPDGVYPEGPSYWNYGTLYSVLTIVILENALGRDFGHSQRSGFPHTAAYFAHLRAPSGLAFNYADGVPRLSSTAAFTWLVQRFKATALAPLAREAVEEMLGIDSTRSVRERFFALHCLWFPSPDSSRTIALPLDAVFHGAAEVAVFRSAWNDPNALFVGLKAGSNRVNHAHLDLGSFVLEADGLRWAVDLGRDDYNLPGYFGEQRWSYFRVNSLSHNTVGLEGRLQPVSARASIIKFESTPRCAFAIADLSSLYGDGVVARRGIAVYDRTRVLIQDEVHGLADTTPLRWQMLSGAEVAVKNGGRTAILQQRGRTLRAELLDGMNRFAVEPATPASPAENQNQGMCLLTVTCPPERGNVRLAILLTPEGDRWAKLPPPELLRLN